MDTIDALTSQPQQIHSVCAKLPADEGVRVSSDTICDIKS